MSRKDDLVNLLVTTKKTPNHDELKNLVIHLKDISLGKIATDYEKKHGIPLDYPRMSSAELIDAILEYDEPIYERTGSHILPEDLINIIAARKQEMIKRNEWTMPTKEALEKRKQSERKKFGTVAVAKSEKMYSYETEIPKWVYFTGKEVFIKMIDGDRILIGDANGNAGIAIHGSCNVDSEGKLKSQPASVASCAVALSIGKVSKMLKIHAVLDNTLVNKSRFITIIKDYNVRKDIDSTSSKDLSDYLATSPSFKKASHVYIEKVEVVGDKIGDKRMPYEEIGDVTVAQFRKSALADAGRVFMLEMTFGTNDGMSQVVKRNIQLITKVYTNPRDVRISKILETVTREADNKIKRAAEEDFLKTKSILDDATFIEGMNEVRWKISKNSDMILEIIGRSNMTDTDKETLRDNIDSIKRQEVSLADIIELAFNRSIRTKSGGKISSPLKHRALKCTVPTTE